MRRRDDAYQRSQSDGDEEDVEGVEGFVEVVTEETEGGGHQDGEGDKGLEQDRSVSVDETEEW